VGRWSPLEWSRAFSRARRFILGGGGLLQETSGPWNYAYYLTLVLMARLFGCRTEVRAIGVDPVEWRLNRWWTRFVFNHCVDSISVRDSDSQLALEGIGVMRPIFRTPDLVFQLPLPPAPKERDRIALVVSPWPQRPGWGQDIALLADRIVEQLKVSVDLLVFYPDQDEALSQKAAQTASHGITVRRWEQPEDLLQWIGEYQLVVGMRYHALVLAAMAEKPFIGWGFEKKIRSICREFGQAVWTFERGWDADAVFRQIGESYRHRDILPQRFRARLPQLRAAKPVLNDVPRIHPSTV